MADTDASGTTSFVTQLANAVVVIVAFAATAYLAWYRLPPALFRWAKAGWWHWPLAVWPSMVLFLAPCATLLDARSLAIGRPAGAHRRRWILFGYVGRASSMLLVLWAFAARPNWWVGRYWWIWSTAAIAAAVTGAAGWMFLAIQDAGAPKGRTSYSDEWRFNHGDTGSPPTLGLAMSGGGIRSAAFNIGVLQALHEIGILPLVDVMSAVSGGSYAMSWYLLQPYYAARAAEREGAAFDLAALINEMFDPAGRFQAYLCQNPSVLDYAGVPFDTVLDATVFQPLRAFMASLGNVAGYNGEGAIREDYREGIQRLFHGHPAKGRPGAIQNEITSIDQQQLNLDSGRFCTVTPVRYPELSKFVLERRLPFFVFNGAVLVDRAHRNMLWPTAFELTAADVGSDVCGYRAWSELKSLDISDERAQETFSTTGEGLRYMFRHREERRPNRWLFIVNLSPAISGAAIGLSYVNPNAVRQRLATWTPFIGNVDLGYLFPLEVWNRKGALYVSDGGHCDNLGAYALLKRHCRTIIVVDAEHEPSVPYVFESYLKLKTALAAEMQLDLNIPEIDRYLASSPQGNTRIGSPPVLATGIAQSSAAESSVNPMSVIYIKLALDRQRLDSYPAAVREYAQTNGVFPQDPTSNQSYTTEQFLAYRELGRHVAAGVASAMAAL